MKTFRVVYERDESGHWIATVPAVKGCHTYGRSINQARERIREALGLFVSNARGARLTDDVRLPADLRRLLEAQHKARRRAEQAQAVARTVISHAARKLVKAKGLSVRDAGELLALSHQRVQQLVREGRRA